MRDFEADLSQKRNEIIVGDRFGSNNTRYDLVSRIMDFSLRKKKRNGSLGLEEDE
jgi:hypothetical protein